MYETKNAYRFIELKQSNYCRASSPSLMMLKSVVPMAIVLVTALWYHHSCDGRKLTNPVLQFKFCDVPNLRDCVPSEFGANSTLIFGNIVSGTYFYNEDPYAPSLAVACTATEPLRWRVDGFTGTKRIISVQSIALRGDSGPTFRYQFFLAKTVPGRVRCESYEDGRRAAEIYIAARDLDPEYSFLNRKLIQFAPLPPTDGSSLVIPCNLNNFHQRLNFSMNVLLKVSRSQILPSNEPSDECLQCFPQIIPKKNSVSCTHCGPFGLTRKIWVLANRPGISSSQLASTTGRQDDEEFLQCAANYNCSAKVIKSDPLMSRDCNDDAFVSCSDHFTALRAYPDNCDSTSDQAPANFRSIEGCLMGLIGTSVVTAENDYDPRIGFRLKGEPDYDAVYMCPGVGVKSHRTYLTPYAPKTRINASLYHVHNDPAQPLDGIVCSVPSWYEGNVNVEMIECSTLSDCELQQWTEAAEIILRDLPTVLKGEAIALTERLGKVIARPFSHGVVRCSRYYSLHVGYVCQSAYYFTGLDEKSYFTTDSFPTDAIINLKPQNPNFRLGIRANFTCKISSFNLFRLFRFTLEFQNGSSINNEGVAVMELVRHRFTAEQWFSTVVTANLTKISCSAPLRTTGNWLSASLSSTDFFRDNVPEDTPDVEVTAESPYYFSAFVNLPSWRVAQEHNFTFMVTDTRNILGQGQFGVCFAGEHHGRSVAVKVIQKNLDVDLFKEFLREVKLMAFLGKHANIVEFIGAVIDDISESRCVKAIVELSPYGDLLSFLRGRDDPKYGYIGTLENLELHHLSYFCQQIASGMEFLAKKQVIHGDLVPKTKD